MAEYISSNDDAGNLALYGGIGVAAFTGGAALAYRATSPIYKGDKKTSNKESKNISEVAMNETGNGVRFKESGDGGMRVANRSTVNQAKKRLESKFPSLNLGRAKADLATINSANAVKQMNGLIHSFNEIEGQQAQQLAGINKDIKTASDMIKNSKDGKSLSPEDALKKIKETNPNSLAEADDIKEHVRRSANQPLSRDDMVMQANDRYRELQGQAKTKRKEKQALANALEGPLLLDAPKEIPESMRLGTSPEVIEMGGTAPKPTATSMNAPQSTSQPVRGSRPQRNRIRKGRAGQILAALGK